MNWEKIRLLLLLYKAKDGVLRDIADEIGERGTGKIYRLKSWLIKNEILVLKGYSKIKWGYSGEKEVEVYKINKEKIDKILCGATILRNLYLRILDGAGFWEEIKEFEFTQGDEH